MFYWRQACVCYLWCWFFGSLMTAFLGLLMWFLSLISLPLFFLIVSISMYVLRVAHTPHNTCEDRRTVCGEQPREMILVHLSWACRERRPMVNRENSYHTPRKGKGQNSASFTEDLVAKGQEEAEPACCEQWDGVRTSLFSRRCMAVPT